MIKRLGAHLGLNQCIGSIGLQLIDQAGLGGIGPEPAFGEIKG